MGVITNSLSGVSAADEAAIICVWSKTRFASEWAKPLGKSQIAQATYRFNDQGQHASGASWVSPHASSRALSFSMT
jgi:hypothetical protein